MTPLDQRDYMMFLDYFANVVVGGLHQMNLPFQFKTLDDWLAVFSKEGFVAVGSCSGFSSGLFSPFQPRLVCARHLLAVRICDTLAGGCYGRIRAMPGYARARFAISVDHAWHELWMHEEIVT